MNVAALNETATHLRIVAINLYSHSADVHPTFVPGSIDSHHFLNLQWGATQGRMVDILPADGSENVPTLRGWHVVYGTVARVVLGVPTEEVNAESFEPDSIVTTIRAEFLMQYLIDENWHPDDLMDRLGEFAQNAVTHQVWPYWREYLQNTAQRMGLPQLVLGFRYPPPGSSPATAAIPESAKP